MPEGAGVEAGGAGEAWSLFHRRQGRAWTAAPRSGAVPPAAGAPRLLGLR